MALLRYPSQTGSCCGMFRGEPAIAGFDWPFTTKHRSSERFANHHRFGPPSPFRRTSACPRLDHPASGHNPVTPRSSYVVPLQKMRTVGYPTAPLLQVSLATEIYSLARSPERTIQLCSAILVHIPHEIFLRTASSLSSRITLSPFNFRLFSPPYLGCFSAFPHGTITLSVSRRV